MPGLRRTAVIAAALLVLSAAWATAQSPQQHVLPAGTPVVFISDGHLDPGAREGATVAVHLRDPLVLDGADLAPAGARARLIVGGTTDPNGKRTPSVSLEQFTIKAGLLPVHPKTTIVLPVSAGAEIAAATLAEVDHLGDRYSIRVPFPFKLSNDRPAAYYTPTPARTANPRAFTIPGRRRGLPSPTPAASASPVDTAPSPAPSATKIPG